MATMMASRKVATDTDLVTVRQAAQLLNMCERLVYYNLKRGALTRVDVELVGRTGRPVRALRLRRDEIMARTRAA